jgi:hypothetical protein
MMTTSIEDSAELEAKTSTTPRLSRHKARRRKRIAVRAVLILSAVIGIWAVSEFSYHAYAVTVYVQPRSGYPFGRGESYPDNNLAYQYDLMQRDAIAALMAVVLLIGSTVISRRIERGHRDRDAHA